MSENSSPITDLFGDPVPANWGMRGRPEHIPTSQNRKKVDMLVALGRTNKEIAAELFITLPTLRRHYNFHLAARKVARQRMNTAIAMKLWAGVEAGNVAATKAFLKFLDRNDLMLHGQTSPSDAARSARHKPPKLGKKEAARQAAREPDVGTTLGELMARRQGQSVN